MCQKNNLDAIHNALHEISRYETRQKASKGLLEQYFLN